MRYHNITKDDMLNGDGLRVVLWLAGCTHHCKNCQNPITWDPNGGLPFDEDAKQEIFEELEKDYVDRHYLQRRRSSAGAKQGGTDRIDTGDSQPVSGEDHMAVYGISMGRDQ